MGTRKQWPVLRPRVPVAELLISAIRRSGWSCVTFMRAAGPALIGAIRRSGWFTRIVVAEAILCGLVVALGTTDLRPPRIRGPVTTATISAPVQP